MNIGIKKFIRNLLLFCSPIIILLVIELFILPIDFFTFRFYETLRVGVLTADLHGPFYPNTTLKKIEQGDLGAYSTYAVKRNITTHIDRYGFRKQNENKYNDIVIIGDSYIWGSNLSQEEMLSEVLETKTGKTVYPLAPSTVNFYLTEKRFAEHPPKIIIVASVERFLDNLPAIDEELTKKSVWFDESIWQKSLLLKNSLVITDRILDSRMYNCFKSKINNSMSKKVYIAKGNILFIKGEAANNEVPEDKILRYVSVISGYNNYFRKHNIKFIFLPIPNKENIYYNLFSSRTKPNTLRRLIKELERRGVSVLDTQSAFENAYDKEHRVLYHTDDTHWNYQGVELTANLIESTLGVVESK